MKIVCTQENLARGLSIASRAVPSRSTLPMASNILLATDGPRLKLAATNLEIGITTWVVGRVEKEGAVAVPARLLNEYVASLPAEQVTMELPNKSRILNLACARYHADIRGADPEDFPPVPTVTDEPTTSVAMPTLRDAITRVALAAAPDDTRPALAGVLCSFEGDELTLAAADGYRLAVSTLKLSRPVSEKVEVIIPARALLEVGRLTTEDDEDLEISIAPNRGHVLFHTSSVDLVSRLIDANFPNYRQIIPPRYGTRMLVDTAEFQKATKIAFLFARDASNIVRLQIVPGEEGQAGRLICAASATDVGDNSTELDALVEGDSTQIAFNARYLLDVLGVVGSSQVALEVTSPSSPGVVKPVGDDSYTHVIMPMHLAK